MKKYILHSTLVLVSILLLASCKPKTEQAVMTEPDSAQMATINESPFGNLPDGSAVTLYTFRNAHGTEMKIINYGGYITSLRTKDRSGVIEDVVLGYDSLSGYLKAPSFFGCIVGRYGNRIAKGQFTLDGKTYTLVKNNGENHLHGGTKGFDKVMWSGNTINIRGWCIIKTYLSQQGYGRGISGQPSGNGNLHAHQRQ